MTSRLMPGLINLGVAMAARRLGQRRPDSSDVRSLAEELLPGLVGLLAASAVGALLDRHSRSR